MAREEVLRKRSRDGNKVCTTYIVPKSSYALDFETCDGSTNCVVKDSGGRTIVTLTMTNSTTVLDKGAYNICIEGTGTGTLYSEFTEGGSGNMNCCEEMRQADAALQSEINNITSQLRSIETKVNNIITGATSTGCCNQLNSEIEALKQRVRALENASGGSDCCDELRSEITSVKNRLNNVENNITNIINRVNTNERNIATIENNLNAISVVGGTGISVSKNGFVFTVTNTSPGGSGGGGGTDCCNELRQKDTELQSEITYLINRLSNLNISAGAGISVTKSGDRYTITNTVTDTDTKPVLTSSLTSTCDIGGISAGTTWPVGTSIESILRSLFSCGSVPPQPTPDPPWFTSEIVDRNTWQERWNQLAVNPTSGEYIIELAQTFEGHPVKFDVPVSIGNVTLYIFNPLTNQWQVTTRDFTKTNTTRTIDGNVVEYNRYTDAREATAAPRQVKVIWNV